ncbi:hypothetical protein PIB30_027032 [Stylosanthes scabra]|uniref:Zinc finger GRF-type domain-containing protein n=1 Tax=Stylosanthes scabra TaxID=79078 RepID=A0ABU6RB49_9FABA|nr:hypothetical protein [Stylosanthes scabra]
MSVALPGVHAGCQAGVPIREGRDSSPLDACVGHMPSCTNPPPTSTPHCRYFAWLDECVPSFVVNGAANREEVLEGLLKLEEKIVELERVVAESNSGDEYVG